MKKALLAGCFALYASSAHAQYIDGLPAAASVSASDLVPVVQGAQSLTGGSLIPGSGAERRATVGQLTTAVGGLFVPYTGASSAVNLGAFPLTLGVATAPSAPGTGGAFYVDTSNVLHFKNGSLDMPLAGACFNASCTNPNWWIGNYGVGEPNATTSDFATFRVQKKVTGSGGSGLANGLWVSNSISGSNGANMNLISDVAAGASSLVMQEFSTTQLTVGMALYAPGLASGTTIAAIAHSTPSVGQATVTLSTPAVTAMYAAAGNQIGVGASAATEAENALLSRCDSWQTTANLNTCVAGFFASNKWMPGGTVPFAADFVAVDHTGLSSLHSGSSVVGAEFDANASGPDDGSYFSPGVVTSATGIRKAIHIALSAIGPSADGTSVISDGAVLTLNGPGFGSYEPTTVVNGYRVLGIPGWGSIANAFASDGSGSGQVGLSLASGFVKLNPSASAGIGATSLTLPKFSLTTGQLVSDVSGCIPAGTQIVVTQEGSGFSNDVVSLVHADGTTPAPLTCTVALSDLITFTNKFSDGLSFSGTYTDAFANLTNTGATGVIKLGSTLNTGTVGKLSFMGQDSTGSTVDYGDLTGSVVTNTHGATVGALDMPVLATGGTVPRLASKRAGDVVNVVDFGADPTDTTDSTAAINAAISYIKASRSVGSGSPGVTGQAYAATLYFPAGGYKTTAPINLTGLKSLTLSVSGKGAFIDCQATGVACVDAMGSRWLTMKDLTIYGSATNIPSTGVQIGRISALPADGIEMDDIVISGSFSLAGFYNLASETGAFRHLFVWNTAPNAYGVVEDGINHFGITTVAPGGETLPADTANSFNENLFENASVIAASSGSSAIWYAGAGRHTWLASYAVSAGYGAVIYSSPSLATNMLTMDIHFETSPITDVFYLDGPGPTTLAEIRGLTYRDNFPESSNSIFKANAATIASVYAPGIKIEVDNFMLGTSHVFDNPSIWTVSGTYQQTVAGTEWNLTAANFTGITDIAGVRSQPSVSINIGGVTMGIGMPAADPNFSLAIGNGVLASDSNSGGGNNGLDNTGVGQLALNANTTGAFNTAVGEGAIKSNTTGNNNSSLGFSSLFHNTTGVNNTAVGVNAGLNNLSASTNTAIGTGALFANTVFNLNVAVGSNALSNLAGGTPGNTSDVAVGANAGQAVTTGGSNTLIGAAAGNLITTGSNNVQVGTSGPITTGSGNILLGNALTQPTATASNQIDIGDQIVGVTGASGYTQTVGDLRLGRHLAGIGTAPALTACGTAPAITGTDAAGDIVEGTTSTGCVATFAVAFSTAPHCVVSSPNGAPFTGYSTTTTALTITNASASGNKYSYICVQ